MSRSVLALPLVEPSPPAPLEAPRSLRAGVARIGADELVVLTHQVVAAATAASRPAPGARFAGLHAIHACYDPEPTTAGWLRGVLAALRPLAPSARWFAWSDGLAHDLGPGVLRPGQADVAADDVAQTVLDAVGRECYRDLLRPRPPVQLLSHRLRSLPVALEQRVAEILRARGLADAVVLFGGELDGHALALGMAIAPGVRPPSRTIGLLRNVAGHLNTARRLRARLRLGEQAAEAARGEATPAGRGEARSIAPRAVAALDEEGAIAWADPPGAARLWDGLVRGTHALVDHWEVEGRGWMLARRCQDAGDPAALRAPEAAVLVQLARGLAPAEVGARLGVSPATVALHVAGARARLRCGTRRELEMLLSEPVLAA